ncbi:hypothetical protein [Sphingomonas aerolata]|uniref:hypothetical protein n=1 Tax=Sphingomonas aerolata TaxID=185951 RepID=UPI0033587EF8
MTKFSPAMLVPAQAAGATSAARSAKGVALANIARMKHLFLNPGEEGKRTFKLSEDGKVVSFTLRVSNTPLVLGQYDIDGVKSDVREMTCPKAAFADALDYFTDKVNAGEFDAQLTVMGEKKEARVNKLRATRATRKAEKPA